MNDKLIHLLGGLPFLLMTVDSKSIKLNWTRIVEGLLIAGVAAFASAYITVGKLELKLNYLEQSNKEFKVSITETIKILKENQEHIQINLGKIDTLQKEQLRRENKNRR